MKKEQSETVKTPLLKKTSTIRDKSAGKEDTSLLKQVRDLQ